jgi:DNA-binding transcriptional regulator YbjK
VRRGYKKSREHLSIDDNKRLLTQLYQQTKRKTERKQLMGIDCEIWRGASWRRNKAYSAFSLIYRKVCLVSYVMDVKEVKLRDLTKSIQKRIGISKSAIEDASIAIIFRTSLPIFQYSNTQISNYF